MKLEPPELTWIEPWHPIGANEGVELAEELQREICCHEHLLFGRATIAVGARRDLDDFLFYLGPAAPSFALVHLTWARESRREWPYAELFETAQDWMERGLKAAVLDYEQTHKRRDRTP